MKANIWLIDNDDHFNQFTAMGGKVIILAEEPEYYLASNPSAIGGSILLPSYDAVSAEIDGDLNKFKSIYIEELMSNERFNYFISILAALYQGIPIGIYIGMEEREMKFVDVFLEFIYYEYGIIIGVRGNREPYILDQYDNPNLDKIYIMGLIPFEQFVVLRRGNISDNPNIWTKILADIKSHLTFNNAESLVKYLDMLKRTTDWYGYYVPDPLG